MPGGSPHQVKNIGETISLAGNYVDLGYGNFDIIFDQFSRSSQLRPTLHALCAVFYLVPMLIGW